MVNRMSGGNKNSKSDKYLIKILEDNANIFKYEAKIIVKAFVKTLAYFINNCIEFSINDILDYKTVHKNACNCYIRYRDEWEIIPEHYIMKIKFTKKLKDYLNSRNEFKEARHREILPDGIRRKIKLF